MDRIVKFFPAAIGLLLAWILLEPPEWLGEEPWLRNVLGAGLAAVFLVGFVAMIILANLPSEVRLSPLGPNAVPAQLQPLVERCKAFGFASAGPILKVGVSPPAILVPLVHEGEMTYSTIFATGTNPPKTSFDFVSVFERDLGGLTTSPEALGGTLPLPAGDLKQTFPGAEIEALFEHHKQGLAYVVKRGIQCRAVSASTFASDFEKGIASQRESFLEAPLRNTIMAIWRTATKTNPFAGPLADQAGTKDRIENLRLAARR